MSKVIGAFLIISVFVFAGYYPLWKHVSRMKILHDFIRDFRYLHNELETSLSSVPDLIDYLCEKSGATTKTVYLSLQAQIQAHGVALFSEDWIQSFNCHKQSFTPEEFNHLSYIGDILGKYVLEDQLSEIKQFIKRLETAYENEKNIYKEKKPICLGTGISLGLMLSILLI